MTENKPVYNFLENTKTKIIFEYRYRFIKDSDSGMPVSVLGI